MDGTKEPLDPQPFPSNKFNLIRASAIVAIVFTLVTVVFESWKRIQFESLPPIGQALSERDPELFRRELQEHRDAAKANDQPEAAQQGSVHPD